MRRRHGGGRRPEASPRARRPGGGGLPALQARLTEVIEPVTRAAGFELERIAVSRVGRRYRVQVVVDSEDGVGLDAIAEVSRVVSPALDAADEAGTAVVPGEYVLEVSSPGVDRPLTQPRHWRRNLGRLVTVPVADEPAVTGRIAEVAEDGVLLEVDGAPRRLAYSRLGPGRVEAELQHRDGEWGPDGEWGEDDLG